MSRTAPKITSARSVEHWKFRRLVGALRSPVLVERDRGQRETRHSGAPCRSRVRRCRRSTRRCTRSSVRSLIAPRSNLLPFAEQRERGRRLTRHELGAERSAVPHSDTRPCRAGRALRTMAHGREGTTSHRALPREGHQAHLVGEGRRSSASCRESRHDELGRPSLAGNITAADFGT